MPLTAAAKPIGFSRGIGQARWAALLVLCTGTLMVILDLSVVNVALPSIQKDLGFSQAGLAWVMNAYLISLGGSLLLAGRLGDLIGRKRLFIAGLLTFTAASMLCGLSGHRDLLVAARFVQGIGAAMSSAVVLGIIVTLFPEPLEQAKAIGIYSFVAAFGSVVGLLAGGALTHALDWHWAFFINPPLGLSAAVLARRLLGTDQGLGWGQGADVLGAALVTTSLMLGVYTLIEAAGRGWGSGHTLGFGALSIALLAAFLLRQSQAAHPLLPLRLFRSRRVSMANLLQALMVGGMFGFQFLAALYLQQVLGYSALGTGVALLPVSVAIAVLSLGFSAKLNTRFGAEAVLVSGLISIVLGFLWLARLPVEGRYVLDLLPAMLLLGIGVGAAHPAMMVLAMSGATASDSGVISGLFNTTQQVGGALGLATLASLASAGTTRLLEDGAITAAALTSGYRQGFGAASILLAAAVLLSLTLTQKKRSIS